MSSASDVSAASTATQRAEEQRPALTLPWSPKSALIVCFSYANFCFFSAWQPLESRYWDFFLRPPVKLDVALRYFLALFADTALLTLLLWGIYLWIRRIAFPHAKRLVSIGFLLLLAIPLNLVRTELGLFTLQNRLTLIAVVGAAIAAVIWHRFLIRPVAVVLMFSWPLFFVEVIMSAAHLVTASRYVEPPLAKRLPGTPPRRLVWIVFDEFDRELAFDQRPANLHLPNLDALRAGSFWAANVYRSQRATPLATASLIFGKVAKHIDVAGPTGITLTFDDGSRQSYPLKDSVYSMARARGLNTAVSGWYVPYCRLFSDSLTDCTWAPGESNMDSIFISLDPPVIGSIPSTMAMLPYNALGKLPGIDRLGVTWTPIGFAISKTRAAHQVLEFERILESALRFSTDAQLGLVYLHFPLPHIYGIYNSAASRVEAGGTYWDNLQLVDKTIGDLRRAMEQAHLWDSTTVLVSADHSLRRESDSFRSVRDPGALEFVSPEIRAGAESRLVPFLLKLSSQQTGTSYESPFNAVLTRDLLLAVVSGEVVTTEQAAQWLNRNRDRFPIRTY